MGKVRNVLPLIHTRMFPFLSCGNPPPKMLRAQASPPVYVPAVRTVPAKKEDAG